eukprot:TRINITY_DN4379_c0_g1_i1.p1 TRINITY_DN4379_c0_g1~~TRINITY_DN4379_c0_g1_i1.p1  ORF type:complete len:436 (+),score=2.23 TRINITY_DN4379_c0_g1_i1:99-1406(+)
MRRATTVTVVAICFLWGDVFAQEWCYDVNDDFTPPVEGQLRLCGNTSHLGLPPGVIAGRLSVFHEGTWGGVCDDLFNTRAALVACRQLSLQLGSDLYLEALITRQSSGLDPQVIASAPEQPLRVPYWMDDVYCLGHETHLVNCSFGPRTPPFDGQPFTPLRPWGYQNCRSSHIEDVILVCGLMDNCNPDPCNGRGVCSDGPASFTCFCDPPFAGTRCEVSLDSSHVPIQSSPLPNGFSSSSSPVELDDGAADVRASEQTALVILIVELAIFCLCTVVVAYSGWLAHTRARHAAEHRHGRHRLKRSGGHKGARDASAIQHNGDPAQRDNSSSLHGAPVASTRTAVATAERSRSIPGNFVHGESQSSAPLRTFSDDVGLPLSTRFTGAVHVPGVPVSVYEPAKSATGNSRHLDRLCVGCAAPCDLPESLYCPACRRT